MLRRVTLIIVCLWSGACGADRVPHAEVADRNSGMPRVTRIVPQTNVAGGKFLGLAPGGRFALFSIGAIDLWNVKVAWIEKWVPSTAHTRPDTILIDGENEDEPSLRLFDLLQGRSVEFEGEPVSHYVLDREVMPLQKSQGVALIDTMHGHELRTLQIAGRTLSLIAVPGGLYALVEPELADEEPAEGAIETFELLRFDEGASEPNERQRVQLDYDAMSPPPSPSYRSAPFLTFESAAGPQVGIVSGCPRCTNEDRSPLTWYRKNVGTAAAPWIVSKVSETDRALIDRIPHDLLPAPVTSMSDTVKERLSAMSVARPGMLKNVALADEAFVTGRPDRDCLWSLRDGARMGCDAAKALDPAETASPARANGCELVIDPIEHDAPPGAIPITCGETIVATAYDLSASEWALVLPDGRYAASPHAEKYLAFYREDGSLLSDAEVNRLRETPKEVAREIGLALRR